MEDNRSQLQKDNDAKRHEDKLKQLAKQSQRRLDAQKRAAQQEENQLKALNENFENELKKAAKDVDASKYKTKSARQLINNFKHRQPIDKAFNNAVKGMFAKKGITPKKSITARFMDIKYNAKSSGKNSFGTAFKSSLNHSIRREKANSQEWWDDCQDLNMFYYDGKYYNNSEFEQIREEVYQTLTTSKDEDINNTSDAENKEAVKKYSKLRNSYKSKLLKLIPEHEEFNEIIKQLEIKDNKLFYSFTPSIQELTEKAKLILFKELDSIDMPDKRRESKKALLDSFISHRDSHIEALTQADDRVLQSTRTTLYVENNLKIPHSNQFVDLDQKQYIDCIRSFYKKNFPDNNLKLCCLHFDESKINPMVNGTYQKELNTGHNLHTIIDAQCNKTGKYNYREKLIEFARKNQSALNEKYGLNFNIPEDTNELTDKEFIEVGQIFQMKYALHLQVNLFKTKYMFNFVDEKNRQKHNYIRSMLEQHLPLELRDFNRQSMLLNTENELKENINTLDHDIQNRKDNITQLDSSVEEKQKEDKKLDKSIESKGEQKKELSSEIFGMLGKKDQLSTDIENLENKALEQALTKVDAWMKKIKNGKNSDGFTALSASAAVKAIDKLAETQPEIAEQVTKTAVTFEEKQEKAIEEHLKISNKVKSNIDYNSDDLKQIEENQKLCIHNKDPQKCRTCSAKGGTGSKFKI
ncbi:hypothetical protein BEL05_00720 [Shewanella colwelliana]|uniref:Uncharacterized protein n=1 Tax=Shewanella colwelliana TaxID=23 RepID=A0A1E5IUH5_SHECO|nr:hypothetical protein [Shewanella colwelliana]OEG74155.1 hypothetical protein BEL05_00720 [Shewanella colwelliana]